jgi:ankyrin repeat protein
MTYHVTFKGKYTFQDHTRLEAACNAFEDNMDESCVDLSDFQYSQTEKGAPILTLDFDNFIPASTFQDSEIAICEMAQHARSGGITSQFEGDGAERTGSGKQRSSKGLPIPDTYRWSMYFAVRSGDVTQLDTWLSSADTPNPTYKTVFGTTSLLHVAADEDKIDCIRLLIEHGADTAATDARVWTPIQRACSIEALQCFTDQGAELHTNLLDDIQDPTTLAWLLQQFEGRELDEKTRDTIWSKVIYEPTLFKAARQYVPLPQSQQTRDELTEYMARKNPAHIVRFFLENGGSSPLSESIRNPDKSVFALLLSHGTTLSEEDKASCDWDHPMCVAAGKQRIDLFPQLLEMGCLIDPKENSDAECTPLHRSINKGQPEATRWLLQHGANPMGRNKEGWSPMRTAGYFAESEPKAAECAAILLAYGAEQDETFDYFGQRTMDVMEQFPPEARKRVLERLPHEQQIMMGQSETEAHQVHP